MILIQTTLTPDHYAQAILALVNRAEAASADDILIKADNWLTKRSLQAGIFLALLALLAWSIIATGLFSPLTLLVLLAIPIGNVLLNLCWRALAKLDRAVDARLVADSQRELIARIRDGSLNVHLGPIRIELDPQQVRTTIDATTRSLAWREISTFAHTDEVAILFASKSPQLTDVHDAVIIPLENPATRDAVLSLARTHCHAR